METFLGLKKVISGGQTGADQAGLIAAHLSGLQTGGTAPSNWYTESGPNPLLQVLGLTAEGSYRSRTEQNVKNSDGTVLLTLTMTSPGSILTRNMAKLHNKPFFEFDITELMQIFEKGEHGIGEFQMRLCILAADIALWVAENEVGTLNVAGNREKTKHLSTTRLVTKILQQAFVELNAENLLRPINEW